MPGTGFCPNGSRKMKPSNNEPGRTPRPEDFPIGSVESRAAARLCAEMREDTRKRVEIVSHIPRRWCGPGPEPPDWNKPGAGEWMDYGDVLMRIVYKPSEP
jgi:hypothetical protein